VRCNLSFVYPGSPNPILPREKFIASPSGSTTMPLIQIITVLLVLFFAIYLFNLLALDIVALVVNAVLIFSLLSRILKAIRQDLDDLYIAVALVALLILLVFDIPGFPIYKITWFLIFTHAGAQAALWANKNGHIDFSGLIHLKKKR